jgi:hypothetical protein
MQDTAIPKKMLYGKLYATRRRGRPKMRWLDDVSTDLRKIGINEWRDRARGREAWRHIVKGTKALPRGAVAPSKKNQSANYGTLLPYADLNSICCLCHKSVVSRNCPNKSIF